MNFKNGDGVLYVFLTMMLNQNNPENPNRQSDMQTKVFCVSARVITKEL